jgi:ATP-binding cassette subfamily A (ABC1) protein 3
LEEDVRAESDRINKTDLKELAKNEPLIVSNLVREFKKGKKKFLAVNHLSFGISPNECFGFLGSNGAGKTTTFKILTGEIAPSMGKTYVNGFDLHKNMMKARRSLAFCPQFDYLVDFLTVRDTLLLFCGLRGLKRNTIKGVVKSMMEIFKLEEFEHKLVQKLSGGNKRKVSSAISFIGRPKVVFLDEPTSGMDPAARRYLWTVIKKARDSGMTIVLTTHSMDECEALSTKLGIMVNGQFTCFGSVQHLKDKYGKGYTLILKCEINASPEDIARVEEFVQKNIKFSIEKG